LTTPTGIKLSDIDRTGWTFADTTSVLVNANSTGVQNLNTWTTGTSGLFNTANRNFHFRATGRDVCNNAAFATYTLKLGGVTIASWGTGTMTVSASTSTWTLDGTFTTVATGASGTVCCHGALIQRLNAGTQAANVYGDLSGATSSAIDLTGTPALALFVTWSANGVTPNTTTQDTFSGEVTN
jgi:hypothetical protein